MANDRKEKNNVFLNTITTSTANQQIIQKRSQIYITMCTPNKKIMPDKAENISIFQIMKFNVFECCWKIILVMNERKKNPFYLYIFVVFDSTEYRFKVFEEK